MKILETARSLESEIIRIRRELHKFPECGLILPKTSEFVKNYLRELNIEFKTYEKHSGITALIGKKVGVKTVALRADMDGLMIKEETGLEFSSENENMHACGHDGHTAILLVVAKMLKEREEELKGQIKLIFQPGEEGPGGALPMLKDGVLENPKVDAIFALHLGNIGSSVTEGIDVKSGDVVVSRSNMFAADDQFYIKITGKGGHGSAPDLSIDPVAISIQVINSLQYIVSREIKPSNPAVITVSSIAAGRNYYNIIPDCAEIRGTIRCLDYETRDFIFNRMKVIVHGVTKSMRGDSEIDFRDGYPPLINSGEVVDKFINSANEIIGEDQVHIVEKSIMGGEDASFFFEKVPGCYFFLSTPHYTDGVCYAEHNSKFQIDESKLYIGVALLVKAATDILN
nr:M20 family metallopeptidase [Sedimentibacter sp.]